MSEQLAPERVKWGIAEAGGLLALDLNVNNDDCVAVVAAVGMRDATHLVLAARLVDDVARCPLRALIETGVVLGSK